MTSKYYYLPGKGTVRRKKKVIHKSVGTDDKKLQTSLKKLQVSNIPGIEEVRASSLDSRSKKYSPLLMLVVS